MDYLAELGTLGLGSRLKRLSDIFFDETSDVYRFYNFDLEPRYFGLLSYLRHYGPRSVTDAANALHLTHPAVSQMSRELKKGEWIEDRQDPSDERRRLLSLSDKGSNLVSELEPIWERIRESVDELLDVDRESFLSKLTQIEERLRDTKFSKRIIQGNTAAASSDISYATWDPAFADAFHDLNEEWVRRFFNYEEIDERVLRNPEQTIRRAGGEVFFALVDGVPIGTCALCKTGANEFELIKMAVQRSYQGQGVGGGLLSFALQWAKEQGASRVTLETNSLLTGALKLYQRAGFRRSEPAHPSEYERADVYMEKVFS